MKRNKTNMGKTQSEDDKILSTHKWNTDASQDMKQRGDPDDGAAVARY